MPRVYSQFSQVFLIASGGLQTSSGPWPFGEIEGTGTQNGFTAKTEVGWDQSPDWQGVEFFYHREPTQVFQHLDTPDATVTAAEDQNAGYPHFEATGLIPNTGWFVGARAFKDV